MKIDSEKLAELLGDKTPIVANEYKSKLEMDDAIFLLVHLWTQVRSKDPNTKVGAAVYDASTGTMFLGYNGFNSGMPDRREFWENRNPKNDMCKYNLVVHAEANAMKKAIKGGFNPEASTLYITHQPCTRCLVDWVADSGLTRVRYLAPHPMHNNAAAKSVIENQKLDIKAHQHPLINLGS